MSYRIEFTESALDDLDRLSDFTLERELAREDGDLDLPRRAFASIRQGLRVLEWAPFTCRKAVESPFLRELVIPFGRAGYVALFEIVDDGLVRIAAVRHQLEDDYLA